MATGYYLLDHRQATAQCAYPRRNKARASGTIILHDAEGGTDLSGVDMGAENVANYIRTRDSYGSYHDLVDRDTHIPMAPIDYETWHSVPDNPWSFGICVAWTKADLQKMTYAQRRSYYVPLARVVLKRVADFARRGITVPTHRMLTAAETQARKPGISTHSRTDPSRRSDPFGTGSKYETEFLAVLAELRGNETPQQEEPDMDKEDKEIASKTLATLERVESKLNDVHSGVAPRVDVPWETEDGKTTLRTATAWLVDKLNQVDKKVGSTTVIEAAVAAGVKKVLDSTPGADEAALTAGVVAEVRKMLEAIEKQTYRFVPEEN